MKIPDENFYDQICANALEILAFASGQMSQHEFDERRYLLARICWYIISE